MEKTIVLKVLPYKSCIVKTESGREYRRNRRDLIKTKEEFDDAYYGLDMNKNYTEERETSIQN